VATLVGLDQTGKSIGLPARTGNFIISRTGNFMELFAEGKVDALLAFPPGAPTSSGTRAIPGTPCASKGCACTRSA
jgi:hypothetical protein